jgi:hypothetical protein
MHLAVQINGLSRRAAVFAENDLAGIVTVIDLGAHRGSNTMPSRVTQLLVDRDKIINRAKANVAEASLAGETLWASVAPLPHME